jgi:NAD(P)H-dependent flavin oxidoreductase YrpB (nitropropane dioxygenase family)
MSDLTSLLRSELALQLSPMGSVLETPALPLAFAAAGGHAVYPSLGLPPEALEPILDALSAQTDAFGVNFLPPLMQRETLELAAAKAPYVDFFLAEPDPQLVALVHAGGAICGWQVESAAEARAAEAAGADVVIAKGNESGGRKRVEAPPLDELLDAVLEAVALPVIATGGIASATRVSDVMVRGAAGVRTGTRFIAAAESDAHPVWVAALIAAEPGDSVVSTAFNEGMPVPGPHRVLQSAIDAAQALPDGEIGLLRMLGAEIPVPRFAPFPPTKASTGAVEAMALYAGTSVSGVHAVQPAAEIVAELAAGLPG